MDIPSQFTGGEVSSGWVAIGAAVGFVLLAGSTTAAVPAVYPGAVLVAAAFVVGPSVTLGGAAGVVIHDLFRGAVGRWTAELAIWMLVFAGLIAFLDPDGTPDAPAWDVRSVLLTCAVAGVYATATTAWLATLLGGAPVYTTGADFLPGLLVAVAGALVGSRLRETVPTPFEANGGHDAGVAESDSGVRRPRRFDRRRGTALVGLLAIGVLWLVGAIGLDVFAHDLAQFGSENQLRNYAGNRFGAGTTAAVGVSALVGVYRYGDLVVRLSPLFVGCVVLSLRWLDPARRLPHWGTLTSDRRVTDD
jgi:hypothetical protein